MRKQIGMGLVGGLVALLSVPVDADTHERLTQALEPWEPKEIRLEGDTLTIITRERRMTDQVLRPLISVGVCAPVFIGAPDSYLAKVQEVVVLNVFGRHGYVFSGGRPECQKIGSLPMNDLETYILSRTRMYAN